MEIRKAIKGLELNLKKAAPDIMLIGGVVLSAASVVIFCKKSRETEPVIENFVESLEKAKEDHEDGITNDKEYRRIVIGKTVKAAKDAGKAYWLPTAMWCASTGLIVGGHHILKDRNAALAAVAAGLGAELRTLHQRIVDRFGEEVDKELKYGTEIVEVETRHVDEATGEEKVEKRKLVALGDPSEHSPYARFFDESCAAWQNSAEYNLAYLLAREKEANERLKANGFLFLNDVYDMLGMERSKAGQEVGWRWIKDNPYGDNYVSFGIYNGARKDNRDFVNGYEPSILLDFNVDGPILSGIPERDVFGHRIG